MAKRCAASARRGNPGCTARRPDLRAWARNSERDRVTAFPYKNFDLTPLPMPRVASAELARKAMRGIERRRKRRHAMRRALVLLAAVAVPALAAPGEWGVFDVGDAGQRVTALEPMPFEKAGDSFPGSAF